MRSQDKWQALIGPVLIGTAFELVGVECVGGGKHTVVRIYIDKPGGITIDEIAQLSRQISVIFDVEEPIKGHYTLEVSSPGLERPLFNPSHFKQQLGQKVFVKTNFAIENRLNFKGILRVAHEQGIEIEIDEQMVSINYEDIVKAKVLPDIKIASGK
ncbi:MAG: ribosome maturation factor RimP [Proteobacteria bacterium]|nr:ribosome maturation factor RimP [Pseudomonadota bacterium]